MISYKRKRIKNVLLLLLLIIMIILISYFIIWDLYLKEFITFKKYGKLEKDIIQSIHINNYKLPYDKISKTYYFPIDSSNINNELDLNITISSTYQLENIINDNIYPNNFQLSTNLNYNECISIHSESKYYYYDYSIKFTNLAIMDISNEVEELDYFSYTDGYINFYDPARDYTLQTNIETRLRGTSSLAYPKPSLRIKLLNNTERLNVSLCGMRNDSEWILDSMYTDNSKIRTPLSYDMWNIINKETKCEYYNSLNYSFVELFLNNEYIGVYALKEPIDEKSLNLEQDGIILKGITYDLLDYSEESISNITSTIYSCLEIKYPNSEKSIKNSWHTILSKMKHYYSNNNLNDAAINDTFYVDNLINLNLFLILINAKDNLGYKNTYFSLKNTEVDTKILLTPWDFDITFGAEWNNEYNKPIANYENVYTFLNFKFENCNETIKQLKQEWKILKSIFSDSYINELIDNYYSKLTIANAIKRDSEKWSYMDFEQEIKEIKNWYKIRLEVVDEYINKL